VRLVYLGVALVIGGAGMMLISYHVEGPAGVTGVGKILAFLGFLIYVVGRIWHGRIRKAGRVQNLPHREEKS
jgi:hypothetical protein